MVDNRFPASLDQLYQMLAFIRDYVDSKGFSTSDMSKIELAAEEAIVNIISYGYTSQQGHIEIKCQSPNPHTVDITIKDDGIPYNPLAPIKNDENQKSSSEYSVGGYGVYFIVKIMDEVKYSRENDSNVLTLIKHKK